MCWYFSTFDFFVELLLPFFKLFLLLYVGICWSLSTFVYFVDLCCCPVVLLISCCIWLIFANMFWHLFIFVDYLLTFVDIRWYLLIKFCRHLWIVVNIHWYFLPVCWHLFAFIYLAMRCYLWYLQLFFDICQYLQIFVDICWHVLLFVDTCWSLLLLVVILLLFFSICWYLWTKWSFL